MAKHEFSLERGIPFGKGKDAEMQYNVVLRPLKTADVIDARMEAEKVVFANDDQGNAKGITVVSEVTMGLELLRRQVESVGDIQGPLTLKQIRKMHIEDFELLNGEAEKFDEALEVTAKRGRVLQPDSAT